MGSLYHSRIDTRVICETCGLNRLTRMQITHTKDALVHHLVYQGSGTRTWARRFLDL